MVNENPNRRHMRSIERKANAETDCAGIAPTRMAVGGCLGVAVASAAALVLPTFVTVGLGSGAFGGAVTLHFLARRRAKLLSSVAASEADLRTALAQANSASAAQSKFVAMVSHEIRTPLNGVLGMAQLLKETSLDPAQADYVKAIDTSGRALLGLIEDLLDSARIEAGQFELKPSACNILQIVEDVADIIAPRARAKGVDIATYVSAKVPKEVMLDAARLRQVLLNIAGNAAKFTASGGMAISATVQENSLQFAIEDTGSGLNAEDQAQIFDEFMQVSSGHTRSHEGAGLGLSISRQLVRAMNGDDQAAITLESAPEKGSRFSFSLPIVKASNDKVSSPSQIKETVSLLLAKTPARTALAQTLQELGLRVTNNLKDAAPTVIIADETIDVPPELASTDVPVYWLGSPGQRQNAGVQGGLTRNWLTWPVRRETLERLVSHDLKSAPKKEQALPVPQIKPKKALSVLVAEDNPINALLVTALLGKMGHHVVRVETGRQAVNAIQTGRGPFDLVLMDLHMPEMDGTEAIRRIRRWEKQNGQQRLPIVVLSADGQESAREDALAAGGSAFLLKPLDIDAVRALLKGNALAA
ncbi:ATP-binding protein [Pseudahrensia aquimaris]|uniref:histidine kinase n=1 Tax=Pseudahrensia aquimaris TaxID=744461 RepID=A0ABW3FEP8_9HYPH